MTLNRLFTLIGSAPSARLYLPSKAVSRCHAVVINADTGLFVRDLASRTQVLVNRRAVREADLREGDLVQIGPFSFRFTEGSAGDEAGPQRPSGAAALPKAVLEVEGVDEPLAVEDRVVLIGRRETADISLTENSASSAHAVIVASDGKHVVRDLNSRTGTFVNGVKIHEHALSPGDLLRVGETTLRYVPAVNPATVAAPAPAPAPAWKAAPAPPAPGVSEVRVDEAPPDDAPIEAAMALDLELDVPPGAAPPLGVLELAEEPGGGGEEPKGVQSDRALDEPGAASEPRGGDDLSPGVPEAKPDRGQRDPEPGRGAETGPANEAPSDRTPDQTLQSPAETRGAEDLDWQAPTPPVPLAPAPVTPAAPPSGKGPLNSPPAPGGWGTKKPRPVPPPAPPRAPAPSPSPARVGPQPAAAAPVASPARPAPPPLATPAPAPGSKDTRKPTRPRPARPRSPFDLVNQSAEVDPLADLLATDLKTDGPAAPDGHGPDRRGDR